MQDPEIKVYIAIAYNIYVGIMIAVNISVLLKLQGQSQILHIKNFYFKCKLKKAIEKLGHVPILANKFKMALFIQEELEISEPKVSYFKRLKKQLEVILFS